MFVLTKAPAAVAMPTADPPEKRTDRWVRVAGYGSIEAAPDIAHVSTGVVTEAASARDALTANNAAIRKVIDGLKVAGIPPKDMQTQQFQILPRYKNFKDRGMQQIEAYVVRNRIQVKVRDLARIGDILDRAVKLGAKDGSDISFSVSNAEKRKDKARKKAIENATHRARLLAESAGAKLGPVLTISEEAIQSPEPRAVMLAHTTDLSDDSVPIERGTETLCVRVEVVFALQ